MKRVFVPENAAEAMGLRLQEIRKSMKLTQSVFGRALGVSQSNVAKIERGSVVMNIIQVRKLARVLKMTTAELFCDLVKAAEKAGF